MAEMKLLLADLLEKINGTAISEIEVTLGDFTLGVRRRRQGEPAIQPAPAPVGAPVASRATVESPLAGVFYASASPTLPAYVQPGDEVAIGQVVGLVEAMKVFNEVTSPLAGRVSSVLSSGTEVAKGAVLVELEPS